MIVGVASCPQPPVLLPGMTGLPVAEVEQLREACLQAVRELLARQPAQILIVGGDDGQRWSEDGESLSIVLGRQLLAAAGCAVPARARVVSAAASTAECLAIGRALAVELAPVATGLLVMADGSARRGLKAPGYLDERAAPCDEQIEVALASGDPAGLAALDAVLAAELMVAGRAAWQVLAGATEGRTFTARAHYLGDPFGVFYPVVSWC